MEQKLVDLKELCDRQRCKESEKNDYMRGMSNGLILALAIMEGDGCPIFINEPEEI